MKKNLLMTLFFPMLMMSSCSPSEQKIMVDQNNITQHFKITNDMDGSTISLTPRVTLSSLDSKTYVNELSIIMTIEYEVSYYCNRYLTSCDEYNVTKFDARFSIAECNRTTPLIQNKIDLNNLSNVCSHGINNDTIKILNYNILNASGYYVKN